MADILGQQHVTSPIRCLLGEPDRQTENRETNYRGQYTQNITWHKFFEKIWAICLESYLCIQNFNYKIIEKIKEKYFFGHQGGSGITYK